MCEEYHQQFTHCWFFNTQDKNKNPITEEKNREEKNYQGKAGGKNSNLRLDDIFLPCMSHAPITSYEVMRGKRVNWNGARTDTSGSVQISKRTNDFRDEMQIAMKSDRFKASMINEDNFF